MRALNFVTLSQTVTNGFVTKKDIVNNRYLFIIYIVMILTTLYILYCHNCHTTFDLIFHFLIFSSFFKFLFIFSCDSCDSCVFRRFAHINIGFLLSQVGLCRFVTVVFFCVFLGGRHV